MSVRRLAVLFAIVLVLLPASPAQGLQGTGRPARPVGLPGRVLAVPGGTGSYNVGLWTQIGSWAESGVLALPRGDNTGTWDPRNPNAPMQLVPGTFRQWITASRLITQTPARPVTAASFDTVSLQSEQFCGPEVGGSESWCSRDWALLPDGRHVVGQLGDEQVLFGTRIADGTWTTQVFGSDASGAGMELLGWTANGSIVAMSQCCGPAAASSANPTVSVPTRVILLDTASGSTRPAPVPLEVNGASVRYGPISPDGGWIAGVVDRRVGRDRERSDLVLSDLASGDARCVTCGTVPAVSGTAAGVEPTLRWSPNGRYLAFAASLTGLDRKAKPIAGTGVYVLDTRTSRIRLASRPLGSKSVEGSMASQVQNSRTDWSPNGRYLLFQAINTRLVAGQSNKGSLYDVYVYDTMRDSVAIAGTTSSGAVPAGDVRDPAFSPDGRWISFASNSKDLPGSRKGYQLYVKQFTGN